MAKDQQLQDAINSVRQSNAHVAAKHTAMRLLKRTKEEKPLDRVELNELRQVLRGYIEAMDLLITYLG